MKSIHQYIQFLSTRPILNFVLLLIYYLLVVLPHEEVGKWIAKTLDQPFGRDTYNLIVLSIGIIGFIGYFYVIWNGTKIIKEGAKKLWTKLFVTLLLIIACINILMVVNVEIIHFVQYAVFALLAFPLFHTYRETLFWATVAGAIDEVYQYLILAPQRTDYYDFNDVLIDMIGAVLGLLILVAHGIPNKPSYQHYYQSSFFKGLWAIIGLSGLAFFTGYLALYPAADGSTLFPLIKKAHTGFWIIIHPTVQFHVVRPLEWGLLTGLLWVYYEDMGDRRQSSE